MAKNQNSAETKASSQAQSARRNKANTKPDNTVPRRVYFFKVLEDKSGKLFDPSALPSKIEKLSFDSGDRYLIKPGLFRVCVWNHTVHKQVKLILGKSKLDALPEFELTGNTRPVGAQQGEGILEKTHVVFFRKRNRRR